MSKFNDKTGREWIIAVDFGVVRRVKKLLEIDLMELAGGKLIEKFVAKPELIVDVVYVVCKPDADTIGVTDEQFGSSIDGQAFELAQAAFYEAMIDFFRQRGQVLKAAISKVQQIEQRVTAATIDKINSPEIDKLLEKEIGDSLGNSLASSG